MCRILKIRQNTASHSALAEYSAKLPNIRLQKPAEDYYLSEPLLKTKVFVRKLPKFLLERKYWEMRVVCVCVCVGTFEFFFSF